MNGLYIHLPFCKSKCYYCDFASFAGKEYLIAPYLNALKKEMAKYSGYKIETLYIGGGTPTVLSTEQLLDLLNNVRLIFGYSGLFELTVEVNPESATEEKLRALKVWGINRLSIGVQSLNNNNLKYLGRIHTVERVREIFRQIKKLQFQNVSLDLIYGFPHQTIIEWQGELEDALTFEPQHISLYPLTIEENTPFYTQKVKVNQDKQAEIYEWSEQMLEKRGYEHYEISNWARDGFRSRHNMIYWKNKEYIGLGSGAASHLKGMRFKNTQTIEEYIEKINSTGSAVVEEEVIDEQTNLTDHIILNLRCRDGVDLSDIVMDKYGPAINDLLSKKLIMKDGKIIRLTKRGMLLANQVFKEFV